MKGNVSEDLPLASTHVFFFPLIQIRVTVGLELIPAVTGQEEGHILDRSQVCRSHRLTQVPTWVPMQL